MQAEEKLLDSYVIEPTGSVKYSVIWLHGLGADGYDFAPIVNQLQLSMKENIRFIFPHAPSIPVTLNNGYVMPAWFDIYGLDKNSKEDASGIELSYSLINNLIQAEHRKGISYYNILLVGFSQGGALALYSGLKFEYKLAGIIGLSCYLPRFNQNYHSANQETAIMLAHGMQDHVVLPIFGEAARDRLVNLNYNVAWHSYPMQHQVCDLEINDIARFIERCF